MIEKIIPNKKQQRIMIFMLAWPRRAFFAGEIKHKVGASGFDQALSALAKSGFISSFKKRGNKYVMVNARHGFYNQLRAEAVRILRNKTDDELSKTLKNLKGLKAAVLSGIFAGNASGDCDLVLVGNLPQNRVNKVVGKIEHLVGQEINYAVFEPAEYNYRKNIFDRFMKDIFENEHLVLMDKVK